ADVDDGGGWLSTLRFDEGRIASGSVHVSGLSGEARAAKSEGRAPTIELAALAGAIRQGDIDLGALASDAALPVGTGELRVESRDASVAEISLETEIASTAEARTARLAGRVGAVASASTRGIVTFEAELSAPLGALSADEIRDAITGHVQASASNA